MANILPQLGVTGNPPDHFPYFAGIDFPFAERSRETGDDLELQDAQRGLLPLFQNKWDHFFLNFFEHTPRSLVRLNPSLPLEGRFKKPTQNLTSE
jgi:hypothetical protein